MIHKVELRGPALPLLLLELAEWPEFAQSVLTQTSYELHGELDGKK
jgi:hypothetical protein